MKYYTKEFALKESQLNCLDDYSPIEDSLCDDENKIKKLYETLLNEKIEKAKKAYDTPIEMMEKREDIIKEYKPNKYPKYDLVAKRIVGYLTVDEVLKSYDYQKEKQRLLFENRAPYDKEKTIKLFKEDYEERLNKNDYNIPYVFLSKIDKRLLAMYLIPSSIYNQIKERITQYKREIEETIEKEEKEYQNLNIQSFDILRKKIFSPIVCFLQEENSLSLIFHFEGLRKINNTGYSSYKFNDIESIECDNDIVISDFFERKNIYETSFLLLKSEIENKENKYHISFLLKKRKENTYSILEFDFKSFEINENL